MLQWGEPHVAYWDWSKSANGAKIEIIHSEVVKIDFLTSTCYHDWYQNSKCKNLCGQRETKGFFDNSNDNRWQDTTTSRKYINFILENTDIDRS